jgi:hypothetical protein
MNKMPIGVDLWAFLFLPNSKVMMPKIVGVFVKNIS